MEPLLRARSCYVTLRARRRIDFPTPASNRLRGALGFLLDEHLFRPQSGVGPSGFHDPPRPFALRASQLDGAAVEAGGVVSFELMVFWLNPQPFHEAIARLDWAELDDWSERVHEHTLDPAPPCRAARVSFLTPTELKPAPLPGESPEFATLISRIRDRIAALRLFYGPGPLDADFRGMAERAASVRTAGARIEHVTSSRTSRRSGQSHPLGGFIGSVDYEGELAEFLPWLQAGCASGVGRQTVWGKGVIDVKPQQPAPPPW